MSAGSALGPEELFKIHVSDADLDLLKQKLTLTRFPDELEDAEWEYGVPLVDIKRLVARWEDEFDWRKSEERIDAELPQFTRDISVEGHGSVNVQYVHKRSELEGAVPLLFIHGCTFGLLGFATTQTGVDHPVRRQGLEASLKCERYSRY